MRSGRKWSAQSAIEDASVRLKHHDLVGATCVGRQGLGYGKNKHQRWDGAEKPERRTMIGDEIRKIEEEERMTKVVAMRSQGAWLNWKDAVERRISWDMLWRMEPLRIQFIIRSTYDLLPTPTNLAIWGKTDDVKCKLCQKPCNLEHILSSCNTALTQGRYTWRHDRVLEKLAHHLEKCRTQANKTKRTREGHIQFVRAGQTPKRTSKVRKQEGIFARTTDWELNVDLNTRLKFPINISTRLRPDIVLHSEKEKLIVMLELTVPWESRMEEAFERKKLKYSELSSICTDRGYKTWCFPIEVGCRGFVGRSTVRALGEIGVKGNERKNILKDIGEAADRAAAWLWIMRNSEKWGGR